MKPPKGPRPLTSRPRDARDERVTKSPLPGSPQHAAIGQIDDPLRGDPEDWDDAKTDPHGTEFEQMQHRAKRAADSSRVAAKSSMATLSQLGEVRAEFRNDLKEVREEVGSLSQHVGNLREGFGEMNGSMKILIASVDRQQAAQAQHQVVKFTAEVDVDRAEKLSEVEVVRAEKLSVIDERKAALKFKRNVTLKILAGIFSGGALASLIALLATRC